MPSPCSSRPKSDGVLRAIWFLIVLGALTIATVWLANHPGSVTLHWQGYRADTSVAVLLGAVAAVQNRKRVRDHVTCRIRANGEIAPSADTCIPD